MDLAQDIRAGAKAAVPIMLGYVAIGLPCGILSASIGLNPLQVLIMCVLFYSGAGQFMIPNMWLAGSPIASIIASVSFVNTRQILYAAAMAPRCQKVSKRLSFLYAATITDESFGVNTRCFSEGDWSVRRATFVNLFSQSAWTIACVIGTIVGDALGIPLTIAAFAMTSIFICLLVSQRVTAPNVVSALCAIVTVIVLKLLGLGAVAIFFGAVIGVLYALVFSHFKGGES